MLKKANIILALCIVCVLLISGLPMTSYANETLYNTYDIFQLHLEAIDNYIMLRLYDKEVYNVFVNNLLMTNQSVQRVYSGMEKTLKGDESENEVLALFEELTYKEAIDAINKGASIDEFIRAVPETLKALGVNVENYNSLPNKKEVLSTLSGKSFADIEELASNLKTLLGEVKIENTTTKFSDVTGEKLSEAVNYLAEAGIVSGKSSTTFCPDDNVKREEFSKMLVLALGLYDKNAKSSFEDVLQSDWYYTYVSSAVNAGLIEGYGNTFGSGDFITRQDVATIIYRALDGKIAKNEKEAVSYIDKAEISEYALDAVMSLTSAGMISGVSESKFAPKECATRAQVAEIIYCLIKTSGKGE